MVVDDEKFNQLAIEKQLLKLFENIEIVFAFNGEEALNLF